MKKIKSCLVDGDIFKTKDGYKVFYGGAYEELPKLFKTVTDAKNAYYVQIAWDYLGSAIRDNSSEEKISLGKRIDDGDYENE